MSIPTPHPAPLTIVACVAPARRRRLEAAVGNEAGVEWHDSFAGLTVASAADRRFAVAILDAKDAHGNTAAAAADEIARVTAAMTIVLYATPEEILGGAVGSPAITDLIVAGETDGKIFLQGIVLDAVKRQAAERVVRAMRGRLPESLAIFAEWAIRHPSCNTVESLSDRIGMHRQTAAVWCRKARILRPEELLMWCRLLLVAAILERTNHSVSALATDLDFPSVIALRNQLKRYTGLTALEIRAAGFDAVLRRFDDRVAAGRQSAEPAVGPPLELIASHA